MGAITFSIDPKLMHALQGLGVYRNFVETGTFKGDTAEMAARHFERVFTVEASPELFKDIERRFNDNNQVHAAIGDAPAWLAKLQPQLQGSSIYWLDAHWCQADNTSGETSQCPLIAELEAIAGLAENDIILIDDARLFTATPPPPHEISSWPKFTEIVRRLFALSSRHQLSIINDVIFFYPPSAEAAIADYTRCAADLIELNWKAREFERIQELMVANKRTVKGKVKSFISRILK
jgi:hypothetical protein